MISKDELDDLNPPVDEPKIKSKEIRHPIKRAICYVGGFNKWVTCYSLRSGSWSWNLMCLKEDETLKQRKPQN